MIKSFSRRLQPIIISSSRQQSLSLPRYDGCCRRREFSYSRMLDMGGAPSAQSDRSPTRTANASKNSKVQAVAFDFRLLININNNGTKKNTNSNNNNIGAEKKAQMIEKEPTPDLERIQQLASLLQVDMPTNGNATADDGDDKTQPSLSALIAPSTESQSQKDYNPSAQDIRAKYAQKLKKLSVGSLAGLELAKSKVEDTQNAGGDAKGHLAARKIAIQQGTNDNDITASSKWLPSQASSMLLTYLTNRTIRIVLLPTIIKKSSQEENENNNNEQKQESSMMQNFAAQLKNVIIDSIIPPNNNNNNDENGIKNTLQEGILNKFDNMDPNKVLLVSDRDEYLRVARDMGMVICRLQQKNARRGNITPHYTVSTVGEVQDVVNEINGISFNTVLNR
ncbi:MAG: hypothetical protein ACI8RD_005659 [Bacillariaceae sp.]|jgi:hypothetical protein